MEVSLWHIKLPATASLVAHANPNVPLTAFPKATSIPSTKMHASTAAPAPLYAPPVLHNRNKMGLKKTFSARTSFFLQKFSPGSVTTDLSAIDGHSRGEKSLILFGYHRIEEDDMLGSSIGSLNKLIFHTILT